MFTRPIFLHRYHMYFLMTLILRQIINQFQTPHRYKLYYITSAIRSELSLVFLLPILDLCRNKLATRGNKTERFVPLVWSSCLAAPTALGYVFFLEMQTYVWVSSVNLARIVEIDVFVRGLTSLIISCFKLLLKRLHIDKWLNSISLAFLCGEMLLLLAAALLFVRAYGRFRWSWEEL